VRIIALNTGSGLALVGVLLGCSTPKPVEHDAKSTEATALIYPCTPTNNVVDDYHGVAVSDPYRWLENDHSPATAAWVMAQNRLTFDYLARIPERSRIRQRLTELWNYERFGLPMVRSGRYFFTRNDGLSEQSILVWTDDLAAEPRVLLDPNGLSTDGTVALTEFAVSDDGRRVAYGLSQAGSDWQEWRVRDVDSTNDLPDVVQWVKFSTPAWRRDGQGFFYSRYDEPASTNLLTGINQHHQLYYHQLGTPQSQDRLIYRRPDQKEWNLLGRVSEDGRYLIITVAKGTDPKNGVFYLDLERDGAAVVELLDRFDAAYHFIGNDGPIFCFRTDHAASRGRVVAFDLRQPDPINWRTIVPEAEDTLETATRVGGRCFLQYLRHATSRVTVTDTNGRPSRAIDLPGIGSVSGFGGRNTDTETFFTFTGFATPTVLYRHDLRTGENTVFRAPRVAFEPADYETRQVFYRSKDGTRVPMFITHRKDLVLDGHRPTLLYGYGGFRISLKPAFSPAQLAWMELGGVYAVPNLRGGGEYGEEWHLAGTRLRKQNVFDDFIAAAEWLLLNGVTNSRRLAIMGGSNGGLLVGACMTQRPGLFAAALPSVGVLDMLRFHKFTIGWAWTSDYGSAEQPDEFRALHAYSPLHRIVSGTVYPSTLLTTADHDDRVVPAHSFKFASALQAAHAGKNPVLIRIEPRAGHGSGKPMTKIIEETADRWAFLVRELGVVLPEP
jgi:prolyl oligopeptidase